MQALAGIAAAGETVPDVEITDAQHADLPDTPERNPFWIVLYWSAAQDDPDTVREEWVPLMTCFVPRGMREDEFWSHIDAAARGEFDEKELEQRAANAWAASK